MNVKCKIKNVKLLGFIIVAFYILHFTFLIAPPAHADVPLSPIQSDLQQEITGLGQQAASTGLGERALADLDLRLYVIRIVRGLLTLLGLISISLILYAGFLYMTSAGASEKIETAQKILTQAVIGAAIILSSYGIVRFVNRQISKAIFEQMLTSTQNCYTSNGLATCCREWSAYLAATGAPQTAAYRTWQECRNREQGGALQNFRNAF